MESKTKLKPCPFCGGEAYFRKRNINGSAFDMMLVECKNCGASPYAISVYMYDTKENKRAAIAEKWNRRDYNG